MVNLMICRLCLSQNVNMYSIANTKLQEVYEKLTNIPLSPDVSSHMACYMCYYSLQKSYHFQQQCVIANNVLIQILKESCVQVTNQTPLRIDKESYNLIHRLEQSQVELIHTRVSPDNTSSQTKDNEENMPAIEAEELLPLDDIAGTQSSQVEGSQNSKSHEQQNSCEQDSNVVENVVPGTNKFPNNYKLRSTKTPNNNINKNSPGTVKYNLRKAKMQKKRHSDIHDEMNNSVSTRNSQKFNYNHRNAKTPRKKYAKENDKIRNSVLTLDKNQLNNSTLTNEMNKETETVNYNLRKSNKTPINYNIDGKINDEWKNSNADVMFNPQNGKMILKNVHYYCPSSDCKYQCLTKEDLEKHMRFHDESRPFACDCCGYRYNKKSLLRIHLLTHTGLRPYTCNICGYKCKQYANLKSHIFIHSGIKPYACDICSYKGAKKENLKRHLVTHTRAKPYRCKYCSLKFAWIVNLKKHLITHAVDKPFSCNLCTFKCNRKQYLKVHLVTHTGIKPYSCSFCNYKCTHKEYLENHLLTHT